MEGKALAIDSSIWIYQFQATMRDKEGKALVNAHVLGFLRRISKLLFYGIKPVFVFDGGAPALKRNTIAERKRKKSGAALSHAKVAERLLAAQLRREAVGQAQAQKSARSAKGKGKAPAGPVTIDENTVYLEDLTGDAPKTPREPKTPTQKDSDAPRAPGPSPFSASKNRWHDHDPYHLPTVDLAARVADATRGAAPDPRLATEDELRTFIEEMRPEDFDVSSPAFRELPTEVQYEIVGDLRLKSRQTSYSRLQAMLRRSRTPLDFSKAQIRNLQQRNALTQQLLVTTDTIGQAHVAIPVRIASERNREYVLIKNTDGEGGWILGIRDDGSKENPIQIDQDAVAPKAEADDSDGEMEEVAIPAQTSLDGDLREFQGRMALAGIGKRRTSKNLTPLRTRPPKKKQKSQPLFDFDGDEEILPVRPLDGDDPAMQLAVQESLEAQEAADLRRALEASRSELQEASVLEPDRAGDLSDGGELHVPGRLETALAIANAGPTPKAISMISKISPVLPETETSIFGKPKILLGRIESPSPEPSEDAGLEYLDDAPEIRPVSPIVVSPATPKATPFPLERTPPSAAAEVLLPLEPLQEAVEIIGDSEDDMEDMEPVLPLPIPRPDVAPPVAVPDSLEESVSIHEFSKVAHVRFEDDIVSVSASPPAAPSPLPKPQMQQAHDGPMPPELDQSDEERPISDWSRSPSPVADALPAPEASTSTAPAVDQSWDAAQEMDAHAEEGEFARFLSQVKGKDLDDVRREIDDEIKTLNQQKKAAMRDSDDITQHMIAQIMVMLRLFGIPYITAPMEAEAQCAALVQLGLVEGIITDDSDVFLFGGARVYKNMFNQSKTVECFFLADFARELGLDRAALVELAYLLGSDYVEGLPGVGPVVAMELLKEFPGPDGLLQFKEWWQRVQTGRDSAADTRSKFRQRFKKKFKTLYIADDWPNPAVREAYYKPAVDDSEEPFKWGLPDLDGLRDLFLQELGWSQSKVEELLLPIIQKMQKRNQAQALNKQGNLKEYFDVGAGGGAAPRNRKTYASKRLQQVVNDFRAQKQRRATGADAGAAETESSSASGSSGAGGAAPVPAPAKRGRGRGPPRGGTTRARGRGRARGARAGASRKRKRGAGTASRPRPRPRARAAFKGKGPEQAVDPQAASEEDN
ncbi:hypothetical protein BC834DRAFT_883267 [Gloeopeniophorella convolvens]|nr:hypothetical protein BC834DRAFT_883267 [Gloeopeniophorella convolvens]